MSHRKRLLALALACLSLPARAEDWPAFGGDHSNRHASTLDAINRDTVGTLRPAWIFQTGTTGYF